MGRSWSNWTGMEMTRLGSFPGSVPLLTRVPWPVRLSGMKNVVLILVSTVATAFAELTCIIRTRILTQSTDTKISKDTYPVHHRSTRRPLLRKLTIISNSHYGAEKVIIVG